MVSVVDLCFTTIWCATRLAIVYNPSNYHHATIFFLNATIHTLEHMSHITLAAHLYAWTGRKASPARLAQYLPKRLLVMVMVVTALGE